MHSSSCDMGCFMKNFCFNAIYNITQEPKKVQRFNCAYEFIGKSAVIKYHQLVSEVICMNWKLCFNQLATAYSYPSPSAPQSKNSVSAF